MRQALIIQHTSSVHEKCVSVRVCVRPPSGMNKLSPPLTTLHWWKMTQDRWVGFSLEISAIKPPSCFSSRSELWDLTFEIAIEHN